MGFISRKIFPACGRMCVCCPALRSRSRQPVKRYKKLVTDIFPKSADGELNERKIVKLCEYAAKNPIRIPKITTYLEERFHKELRHGQLKVINVVAEAYNKLLCICGKQLAYFASSVLNVIAELLDNSKQPAMQIGGCQVLTRFIYSQIDGTYSRNIESFIHKVCVLAHDAGEDHSKCLLRASSLQCVSAILWFMTQFSHIFDALDEIVQAALDNYEPDVKNERAEVGHQRVQWVDEVVRCEARGGDASPGCISVRPPPVKKNPSILTKVETETPKVWAQICIQRMAELANESTTLRQILEPMFVYFDNGGHWISQHGLAVMVLSDMCYFMENSASENRQLLLAAVIRHLDQKSIAHDPLIKSYVIQVATYLARQIRAGAITVDVGYVGDLCRHLRKSLQATAGPLREEEISFNVQLQNSIEACLLEIAKGMSDTRSFFDLMTITMEKLPPVGAVARAVIGSLIILAHVSSLASASSQSHQVFPEALLVQLLKAMLHTDTETRIGAHRIFSILLFPNAHHIKQEANSRKTGYCYDPRSQASNISKFASVNTLLEKLRKEKNDVKAEKHSHNTVNDCNGSEFAEEEEKQTGALKNSPNPYRLTSLFDRTAGPTDVADMEPSLTKLSEDQILQLLSGFWIQANLPDNLPSNFEAICHSYSLTLILAHPKNSGHGLVVRFFQLALSLRNISLDPNCGMLSMSCRRLLLVTSTAMLMFAAKTYHINELINLLKSLVPDDVDPYLGINEDLQAFVRPQANLPQFGLSLDNQMAASVLCGLRDKNYGAEKSLLGILARHLCCINKQNEDELLSQLLEVFSPDDALMFAPQSVRNLEHIQTAFHSRGRPSVDDFQDLSATSTADDEGMGASSVANNNRLPAKVPGSPSMSQIIGIGQLLESALEVAGQVAGTSVSTSPLPYSVMASQCESLGTGTRNKLSNWLAHENIQAKSDGKLMKDLPPNEEAVSSEVPSLAEPIQGSAPVKDLSWSLRLPPASPFDNFLRSVGVPNMDVGQVAI